MRRDRFLTHSCGVSLQGADGSRDLSALPAATSRQTAGESDTYWLTVVVGCCYIVESAFSPA